MDAIVYLMLANELIHELLPDAITIAEDVSGGRVQSSRRGGCRQRVALPVWGLLPNGLHHCSRERIK